MESEIRTSPLLGENYKVPHYNRAVRRKPVMKDSALITDRKRINIHICHRRSLLTRRLSERELDPCPIALAGKEPPSNAAAITSAGRSI